MSGSNAERVEYRLVCARHGTDAVHKGHAWKVAPKNAKSDELRTAFLVTRNEDPVMRTIAYRECAPMRIEARFVSEWSDDFDYVEGLAE